MSISKRAFKGYLWNQIGNIIVFGVSFIFSIIIARFLGPKQYGNYAVIMSLFAVFMLFCSLGFEETLNTYVPKITKENRFSHLSYLLKTCLVIRAIIILSTVVILLPLSGYISSLINIKLSLKYYVILFIYVVFESISSLFISFLMGQIKTKTIGFVRVLVAILNVIFGYIVLRMGGGILDLLLILAGTSLISMIIYVISVRAHFFIRQLNLILKELANLLLWPDLRST